MYGFVDVVGALNIGGHDGFEIVFGRDATKMQNDVNVFHQSVHRGFISQITLHNFFTILGFTHGADIGEANHIRPWLDAFAKNFTEAASGL